MKATYKLQGTQALSKALEEIQKTARDRIVQESMMKALEPVRDDASALAPQMTGGLARSIGIGWKLTRSAFAKSQKLSAVEVYVGPSPDLNKRIRHGVLMEFGTWKMRPRPFMRPAFARNVETVLRILQNQMWLKIKLVANRADKSGRGP